MTTHTLTKSLTSRLTSSLAVVGISATVVATSLVGINASPAQAAGIGSGRAIVHVDSAKATLAKQADGSYLLNMPKGTTGQWMGERKNAAGKTKVRVGNLTGETLVSKWSNFRYGAADAIGSLVWDRESTNPSFAHVEVSKPKATTSGVSFVLTSHDQLPAAMADMSLNLLRAPGKATRSMSDPVVQKVNIASDLWIQVTNANQTTAAPVIYNSTNNNHCWSANMSASDEWLAVPTNTCDNIKYENAHTTPSQTYGFIGKFPGSGADGQLTANLNITPPGESMYNFWYTWNLTN